MKASLLIVVLVLLSQASALSADAPPPDLVRELQKRGPLSGCTISHRANAREPRSISGFCAGHQFDTPRPDLPTQELNFCQVFEHGGRIAVASCRIDGRTIAEPLTTIGAPSSAGALDAPIRYTPPPKSASCMDMANPTTVQTDLIVGKGAVVAPTSAVFVRLTKWKFDSQAPEMKGEVNGLMTQVYDYQSVGVRHFPGTMMQFLLDAILGVGSKPMRVGGRRTLAIPCNESVVDIELFEVAESKAQLRMTAEQLPPPPPAIAAAQKARQQQEIGNRAAIQHQQDLFAQQQRILRSDAAPAVKAAQLDQLQHADREAQASAIAEQQLRERIEREQVRARATKEYPALLEAARAKHPAADPVVLGIIMGEAWSGVQDVNNCGNENWWMNSSIPFCLYPDKDDQPQPGKGFETCARISDKKFDTSWIISPYGDAEVEGEGLGAALAAFDMAADKGRQCFVGIATLADGTVGHVWMPTSPRSRDVQTLLSQLKEKYGNHFRVEKQDWSFGASSSVLHWDFPDLHVTYTEQAENVGGGAFDGGSLHIVTERWRQAQAEQEQRDQKPAL